MKCPRCYATRSCAHVTPRTGGRWQQIACTNKTCVLFAPAHKWLCNCGHLWQTCKLHSRWPEFSALYFPESVKRSRRCRNSLFDNQLINAADFVQRQSILPGQNRMSPAKRPRIDMFSNERRVGCILSRNPRLAARFPNLVPSATNAPT